MWLRKIVIVILLLLSGWCMAQERFVYLTADEARIDSVLPSVGYELPLPANHADSIYTATVVYPEFMPMTAEEVDRYHALTDEALPELPEAECRVVYDRKQPKLSVHVMPLVCREGQYQWVVSFMIRVTAVASPTARQATASKSTRGATYADHSVLATGSWAKVRVSSTGITELTSSVASAAGFKDLNSVKIYGYGGALQPEELHEDYLLATDDLVEVPQCIVNGKHLFYAVGPVTWENDSIATRTRNPYSNYGYYFLTEGSDVLTIDSIAFLEQCYHTADDYHSLYEDDGYAWLQGGRNLFDSNAINSGTSKTYTISNDTGSTSGTVYVNLTAGVATRANIAVNDSVIGSVSFSLGTYDKGISATVTAEQFPLQESNTITITPMTGGPVRLDYISITYDQPRETKSLSASFPAAEYVYNITNQDHHADPQADMVIIIPTSQKLLSQAERLAMFHEQRDGMRVNIVPADELYNEFSSGTPDANAYRRYMKLLYDRADDEADLPKYLLLFGDCVWDNRMLTTTCRNLNADDYLLCFESEDSFNEITCYVDDGFFCYLDEGEGVNPLRADLLDVAVGRFPVTTERQATIMVDKTIDYVENSHAGSWQNTLMFIADDGNDNVHMEDINEAAETVAAAHPEFLIKKVMLDSYELQSSSSGNTYPDATAVIKAQQQEGALLFDYGGHGAQNQLSHEKLLMLNDFAEFTNKGLSLWVTASCDVMPFDGTVETIGETAVLNSEGCAVAFFGTTRTVYSNYNKRMNMAFLANVLDTLSGARVTLGEAQRLTKNYLVTASQDRTTNKLQFSLLGDPAISLNIPEMSIVVDSINGLANGTDINLKAGSIATITGHIVDGDDFSGTLSAVVRDSEETVRCRMNSSADASSAFEYTDRTKTIFSGSDNVTDGLFTLTFAVPMDINYSNESGLITLFANTDSTLGTPRTAAGYTDAFTLGGTEKLSNDSIGPSLFCYLNDNTFIDGGTVNPTPYFVAQIYDEDGINTSGVGIGHDLVLTIDSDVNKTYNLNDYFSYDFGSYTSGTVAYSIPTLSVGQHSLVFRAWDIFNNSSTTQLTFNVVAGLTPTISVYLTPNPATTTTTFVVSHNRQGSEMTVVIDVFDSSGRQLFEHRDTSTAASDTYTYTWDLTCNNGLVLQTGVYLYRVRVSSDGSSYTSKARKLVVMR